jgi:DNA segregation ATPase FtsK/SpoIIIE-like protein
VAVIDLKRELAHFSRSERLLWPVATSASDGAVIFHELVRELHKRLELFESVGGCRGLADYNSRRNGNPALSPICLLADESTLLLKNGDKQLVGGIQELALSGRSAGLLMILSGQNWKVGNTGGSEVRDQLSTRIQFKAMSKTQSRLLIESPDAEGLNDLGRAIAVIPGRERLQLQSPLVSRDAIERALSGQRGARQAMPVVDVEPEQTSIADQERERILELGRRGESVTAIMMDVWGSKNGRRARQVRDILDSDGVTG